MRRGEVWILSGGTYASKPRPGIIIQDDSLFELDSVTVIPLTSHSSDTGRLRVKLSLETPEGETVTSFAQVDKITTLRAQNVHKRIGALTVNEMRAIERAIITHLGFGSVR